MANRNLDCEGASLGVMSAARRGPGPKQINILNPVPYARKMPGEPVLTRLAGDLAAGPQALREARTDLHAARGRIFS